MGRGGQGQVKGSGRTISWDEIKTHSGKENRWIVIDGQVYDVSQWEHKHPGGPRLIGHYAGQDATEAFNAFHNDLEQVKKYLKTMHVGPVEDYKDTEIDKDFRKVKETAIKMGLFNTSYTFYFFIFLHLILLEVMAYYTLVLFGTGWVPYIVSIFLYATMQTQHGWTQHDFGHLSVFKSSKWDHLVHHISMELIKGASASWWNHMHFQHHAKPNVIDKDPDVRIDQLFVVGDQIPINVAKSRKKSLPFNFQHRYFPVFAPLLFPLFFQFMLIRHVVTRRLYLESALIAVYFIRLFYMYVPLLGFGWTFLFYFLARCIESHWFTWVAQSNHIPMNIKADEANPWLKLQMHATCDIEKSFFNDWFTGHLNFQIEHHLFPTMPRHNLYKAAPLVKSLCEKHEVPYVTKGLWQSFVDILRSLKSSGELWEETYREFHSD